MLILQELSVSWDYKFHTKGSQIEARNEVKVNKYLTCGGSLNMNRETRWWLPQARRKRCGMAAVAAPKFCRERERKGREGRKGKKKEGKEKREEKKGKEGGGEESKRERCIRPMGVKHPLGTIKRLLKTRKDGGWKKLKKQEDRKKKQKRPEKTWWQRTDWYVRI